MRVSDFLVSVIIPCYGESGLLPEAVCSVLRQEFPCSLVLVNDGCPQEETHRFCLRVRDAYPDRILYLRQINRGVSSARNAGIALALRAWPTVEGVFFLDQDNRLGPLTLRRMYERLAATGAGWVFTDMQMLAHRGLIGMAGQYCLVEHMFRNYVDTGSMVARRVLERGVRFDPAMGYDDWDFWLGAARLGYRGEYVPATGFLYRYRAESLVQIQIRDRDGITSLMRRKHRAWINPGNCVRLEHEEAPRYALLVAEWREDVVLFSDPGDLERRMPRNEFQARISRWGIRRQWGRLPAYLLATSETVLNQLTKNRSLRGLFWNLESAASRYRLPVAAAATEDGVEIREIGPGSEGQIACVRLDVALSPPRAPSGAMSKVHGVNLAHEGYASAPAELMTVIAGIQDRCRPQNAGAAFLLNSNNRRKIPVVYGICSLFGTGTLFPVSVRRRNLGILVKQDLSGRELQHLAAQVSMMPSGRWVTHIFWIHDNLTPRQPLDPVFDTITLLPPAEFADPRSESSLRSMLGLLCVMDLVVNHGCPEWLTVAGELARLSVATLFSVGENGNRDSMRSMLNAGLEYEYAIRGYLPESVTIAANLRARGIPADKVSAILDGYV